LIADDLVEMLPAVFRALKARDFTG
jgi:hypothetical protein